MSRWVGEIMEQASNWVKNTALLMFLFSPKSDFCSQTSSNVCALHILAVRVELEMMELLWEAVVILGKILNTEQQQVCHHVLKHYITSLKVKLAVCVSLFKKFILL